MIIVIKRVLFLVVLLSSMVYANERVIINMINNVSIPNVQKTIDDANILKNELNEKNFTNFLKSWKKVEALYLAGDLDEDYLFEPCIGKTEIRYLTCQSCDTAYQLPIKLKSMSVEIEI